MMIRSCGFVLQKQPVRFHSRRLHYVRPRYKPIIRANDTEKESQEDDLYFGDLFEKGGDPRLYGENVDPNYPLPPEYEADFWESPKFGFIGTAMTYFVPILVALGLIVGGIAAKVFNEGATSYLTPATKDNGVEISPIKETK